MYPDKLCTSPAAFITRVRSTEENVAVPNASGVSVFTQAIFQGGLGPFHLQVGAFSQLPCSAPPSPAPLHSHRFLYILLPPHPLPQRTSSVRPPLGTLNQWTPGPETPENDCFLWHFLRSQAEPRLRGAGIAAPQRVPDKRFARRWPGDAAGTGGGGSRHTPYGFPPRPSNGVRTPKRGPRPSARTRAREQTTLESRASSFVQNEPTFIHFPQLVAEQRRLTDGRNTRARWK